MLVNAYSKSKGLIKPSDQVSLAWTLSGQPSRGDGDDRCLREATSS